MPRYMTSDLFTQCAILVALGHCIGKTDNAAKLAREYKSYADPDLAGQLEAASQKVIEALDAMHRLDGDPSGLPGLCLLYGEAVRTYRPDGKKRPRIPILNGTLFNFNRQPPSDRVARTVSELLAYHLAIFINGAISYEELRQRMSAR